MRSSLPLTTRTSGLASSPGQTRSASRTSGSVSLFAFLAQRLSNLTPPNAYAVTPGRPAVIEASLLVTLRVGDVLLPALSIPEAKNHRDVAVSNDDGASLLPLSAIRPCSTRALHAQDPGPSGDGGTPLLVLTTRPSRPGLWMTGRSAALSSSSCRRRVRPIPANELSHIC